MPDIQHDKELQREFGAAMRNIYSQAKSEAGYNATYFLKMRLALSRRLVAW